MDEVEKHKYCCQTMGKALTLAVMAQEKYQYCCQTRGKALNLAVMAQGRIQITCFGQLTGHFEVLYEMNCYIAGVLSMCFFLKKEIASFYVYGSVHHNMFYEITNRCSYMQTILFHC